MAGDIKWIKITTDMFEHEKIDFILSLPEADAIILIWVRILTLAGKVNESGYVLLTENIPYTEEMIAHKFRKPINVVRLALETFKRLNMITFEGEIIRIHNWDKHQNVDGMEKVKEQNKVRSANYRARKQLKLIENDENHATHHVTSNVTVTDRHATDIELEKEKIKDIVVKHDIPYSEIIDYLNEKAETNYKSNTKTTKSHINARYKEGFTIDDFKLVIDKKCAEWIGTTYEKFLRPDTLFAGKFESYINQSYTSSSTSVVGRTGQAAYRNELPLKTLAQHQAEEQELIEKRRAEREGMI